MFIHFDKTYMDTPKVWVKVKSEKFGNFRGEDEEEVSLFVDNETLAKFSIGAVKSIGITNKWYLTDTYYEKMVGKKLFVPCDDLNEVENICEQNGWPFYEIELGF